MWERARTRAYVQLKRFEKLVVLFLSPTLSRLSDGVGFPNLLASSRAAVGDGGRSGGGRWRSGVPGGGGGGGHRLRRRRRRRRYWLWWRWVVSVHVSEDALMLRRTIEFCLCVWCCGGGEVEKERRKQRRMVGWVWRAGLLSLCGESLPRAFQLIVHLLM